MAISDFRKEMILTEISDATSIHSLIPMLDLMDLSTIKQILIQKVQELNATETSNLCFSSLSIEKILPMDIIQYITSFNNMSNIHLVSHTFHQCFQQSKQKEIKRKETQFIQDKIAFSSDGAVWVVDKTRNALNNNEIDLKYKGPIYDVREAINGANHGDTLLVYDAVYTEHDVYEIDKRLQIIGLGNRVCIECNRISLKKDVCLKNIKFKIREQIIIESGNSLFMNHCSINFMVKGICVLYNSTINAYDCGFVGDKTADGISNVAISIAKKAKCVNILHCVFDHCGSNDGPCIHFAIKEGDCIYTEIKLIDNLFVNSDSVPMGNGLVANDNRVWFRTVNKAFLEGNRCDVRDITQYFIDTGEYI